MGQKVNPISFRCPITKDWQSRWFADKASFGDKLHEDLRIRSHVKKQLEKAAVSRIQIERFANRVRVTVFSARPGLVIGRKGALIEKLKSEVAKIAGGKEVYLDIKEIRTPELNAQLVADGICQQLVRRIAFRRAMKRTIQTTMEMGAEGIKIRCSGRLGGSELARVEQYKEGRTPLQTLRANIDYGFAEANTLAGIIGVKVWICKPEGMEDTKNATNAKTRKAPKGAKGRQRRMRNKK